MQEQITIVRILPAGKANAQAVALLRGTELLVDRTSSGLNENILFSFFFSEARSQL